MYLPSDLRRRSSERSERDRRRFVSEGGFLNETRLNVLVGLKQSFLSEAKERVDVQPNGVEHLVIERK